MDITRLDEDWMHYEEDAEFPEWFYPNLSIDWEWFFFNVLSGISEWFLNFFDYIYIYWEDNYLIDWV